MLVYPIPSLIERARKQISFKRTEFESEFVVFSKCSDKAKGPQYLEACSTRRGKVKRRHVTYRIATLIFNDHGFILVSPNTDRQLPAITVLKPYLYLLFYFSLLCESKSTIFLVIRHICAFVFVNLNTREDIQSPG